MINFGIPPLKPTLIILLAFSLFFLKGVVVLDPDFGWHIRLGEYILTSGIPYSDPLSYTMPSFPYIDHEWLSNILLTFIYHAGGQLALAIVFAILSLFALSLRVLRAKKFYFIIFALTTIALLAFTGIRVQVIGWALFCLLLIAFSIKQQAVKIFIIPSLFLVWANLHGSFPLGLLILLIYQVDSYRTKQTTLFYSVAIVLGSVLATLLNPYGIRLYQESITTITDTSLYWTLSEWSPLLMSFNIAIFTYAILAIMFYIKFGKNKKPAETAIFFLLLFMSLISIRHFPFFLLYSLPFVIEAIASFEKKVSAFPNGKKRFTVAYVVFSLLISFGLFLQLIIIGRDSIALSEDRYYPKMAASYLQTQDAPQRVFAPYNWGGYLLLKIPGSKVFIDGRMPSWTNPKATINESKNAFKEYQGVLRDKTRLEDIISKYSITSFILPTSQDAEYRELLRQLDLLGWKRIHEDPIALVYELAD